jgi:hypothetical protein
VFSSLRDMCSPLSGICVVLSQGYVDHISPREENTYPLERRSHIPERGEHISLREENTYP